MAALEDVCHITSGGTPSKRCDRYWQGHLPWISAKDLKGDRIDDAQMHITNEAVEQSSAKRAPKGSVLILVRGMGLANGIQAAELMRECSFNQDIRALTPVEGMEARYLLLALRWSYARDPNLISSAAHGTLKIDSEKLRSISIPLPPLDEQKRIVAILDEAFEAIETAKLKTDNAIQSATSLICSAIDACMTRVESEISSPTVLEELLVLQPRNGWSPPKRFQTGDGVPVLTLSAVTGFEYNGSKVTMSSAPTKPDAHYWLAEGDLLVTRSNTRDLVGHVAICDGTPENGICPDLIMKMRVNEDLATPRFVYYALRSSASRQYLTDRAGGASGTMQKINKQTLQSVPIHTPDLHTQRSVTKQLDAVNEAHRTLLDSLQAKLKAITHLKQSLLHRAFTDQLIADKSGADRALSEAGV